MTRLDVSHLDGSPHSDPRLEDVSFTVEDGDIAAIYGPERSGKRQLLRTLAGLDRLTGGDVSLDGVSIASQPPHRRRLGVVFRETPLFPGTVHDNVAFGLERANWPRSDRERRVAAVLELVGMAGTEKEDAPSLPENERMRIALARAIAPQPMVLLVESPTYYVDEVAKVEFSAAFRQMVKAIGLTTVIVTDDLRDAVTIADDLHIINRGRMLQSGTLSRVLAGPVSIEVAEMLGYVTLVRGSVDGQYIVEPTVGAIQFPVGFPLSGTARALAHPTAMLGVPEESGLGCGVAGLVERVRATGPMYVVDLRLGDRIVEVRWEWDPMPPALETPLGIAVTPNTLRFFNEPPSGRTIESAAPPEATPPPVEEEDPREPELESADLELAPADQEAPEAAAFTPAADLIEEREPPPFAQWASPPSFTSEPPPNEPPRGGRHQGMPLD